MQTKRGMATLAKALQMEAQALGLDVLGILGRAAGPLPPQSPDHYPPSTGQRLVWVDTPLQRSGLVAAMLH